MQSITFDFVDKHNLPYVPFETLMMERNKDLFIKFWEHFNKQMTFAHFMMIYEYIKKNIKSEEWLTSFFDNESTK
jgi:hypothetical protein